MLNQATIAALAAELDHAERTRTQVRHFSLRHPGMTVADGYAISRAWSALKLARGRSVRGHKIGLTSRAMQQASQIDEPDYGTLFDDMFFDSGTDIPYNTFIAPRIEVELAFVLGRSLRGPGVTLFDVLHATEYVVPAVEIIDARIEQFDRDSKAMRRVTDTISDNAANAGVVLGGRPVAVDAVDLRWVSALLYRNGVIEESGVAAAVLNHPAHGVAWLANRLAQWDEGLQQGEVVLSGSFTRPVAGAPGDVFHVDYGGLGPVTFRLAGE
jgi:2-oxo-hept-3-ene-1,7-dioate hydratase